MRHQSILTVVFLIGLPSFASADLCAGPTVADVLAEVQATGPCTIGDKTFNFTSYSKNGVSNGAYDAVQAAQYDATAVGFTPSSLSPIAFFLPYAREHGSIEDARNPFAAGS